MRNWQLLTIAAAWAIVAASARSHAMVPAAAADAKEIGKMNNAFATAIYGRLGATPGNLFFSPTSIQTALAMTAAGAGGKTADEMIKTLCLSNNGTASLEMGRFLRKLNEDGTKGGYQLSVANALWSLKGYPFMPAYLNLVQKQYGGRLSELDFLRDSEGSRKIINDWVASQTHDKIKDLMPRGSINESSRLVLTNAIYFNGRWDLPFRKERTLDDDFTTDDGKKMRAPLMHQQSSFLYGEDDAVQVMELPYGRHDLAMRVILPKKPDGLEAVEKGLTAQWMSALESRLKYEQVIVGLPRFTIESGFSLGEVLKAMGMKLAFEPGKADFGGMTSAEQLYISDAIHKAYVRVDEVGTEAAAATGLAMAGAALRQLDPPKTFLANHPFLFCIIHRQSGAILFMGRLATPG